jgi:hypothetical protein
VKNRFDLEEAIMEAWRTADDLDLFLHCFMDGAVMTEDNVSNVILGIMSLHNLRMEKLCDVFHKAYSLNQYNEWGCKNED